MRNVYYIPENYAQDGKINGIDVRNIVEAVVMVSLGVAFWVIMPLPLKAKAYAIIATIIFLGAFGIFGINGFSLTHFLNLYMKYKKNAKVIKEPTSKDKIEPEKMLLEKKMKREKALAKEKKQLERAERTKQAIKKRRKIDEE